MVNLGILLHLFGYLILWKELANIHLTSLLRGSKDIMNDKQFWNKDFSYYVNGINFNSK